MNRRANKLILIETKFGIDLKKINDTMTNLINDKNRNVLITKMLDMVLILNFRYRLKIWYGFCHINKKCNIYNLNLFIYAKNFVVHCARAVYYILRK
jgi:hypothetical protein